MPFAAFLAPLRTTRWFVYSKRPFAGPQAVLAYLARYTHRVAIANSRLIAADDDGVTFKWKDYRFEGRDRHKTMTLAPDEFIRRFLIHVLPKGFHRIRQLTNEKTWNQRLKLEMRSPLPHSLPHQASSVPPVALSHVGSIIVFAIGSACTSHTPDAVPRAGPYIAAAPRRSRAGSSARATASTS